MFRRSWGRLRGHDLLRLYRGYMGFLVCREYLALCWEGGVRSGCMRRQCGWLGDRMLSRGA